MKSLAPGARRLPTHHITIRVPWHDSGWAGSVCARPLENTSCLILPRIGEGKRDEVEARRAGQRLDELSAGDLPPCAGGRVSFMAPCELTRPMRHPYAETIAERHGQFTPTRFVQSASRDQAARWMTVAKSSKPTASGRGHCRRRGLTWPKRPTIEPMRRNSAACRKDPRPMRLRGYLGLPSCRGKTPKPVSRDN